jgi:hypothetical protein
VTVSRSDRLEGVLEGGAGHGVHIREGGLAGLMAVGPSSP